MTAPRRTGATAPRRSAGPAEPSEAEGLAAVHLRTGSLALARSELESLAFRGGATAIGFAALAEARWRSGDLEGAAEAAAAHRDAGGDLPVASVILAEAAATAGRQDDAATAMARLQALDADALDGIFAGMPRRAAWPTGEPGPGTVPGVGPAVAGDQADAGHPDGPADGGATDGAPPPRRRSTPSTPADTFPDASDLVGQARDDMRSGDPERMTAAFSRLALALRLDPGLAAPIADLLTRRSEPAAHLVRGDALRIAGRAIDSEAAYAAAARALAGRVRRGS